MAENKELLSKLQGIFDNMNGCSKSMADIATAFGAVGNQLLVFESNLNEQKKLNESLTKKVGEQEIEISRIRKSIILSDENANRNGRPPLTNEEIVKIRELIGGGDSMRKVAEKVGCAVGSVHKYTHENEQQEVVNFDNQGNFKKMSL